MGRHGFERTSAGDGAGKGEGAGGGKSMGCMFGWLATPGRLFTDGAGPALTFLIFPDMRSPWVYQVIQLLPSSERGRRGALVDA
jgi:hypothetical protein